MSRLFCCPCRLLIRYEYTIVVVPGSKVSGTWYLVCTYTRQVPGIRYLVPGMYICTRYQVPGTLLMVNVWSVRVLLLRYCDLFPGVHLVYVPGFRVQIIRALYDVLRSIYVLGYVLYLSTCMIPDTLYVRVTEVCSCQRDKLDACCTTAKTCGRHQDRNKGRAARVTTYPPQRALLDSSPQIKQQRSRFYVRLPTVSLTITFETLRSLALASGCCLHQAQSSFPARGSRSNGRRDVESGRPHF